jgi:hypothetical protein
MQSTERVNLVENGDDNRDVGGPASRTIAIENRSDNLRIGVHRVASLERTSTQYGAPDGGENLFYCAPAVPNSVHGCVLQTLRAGTSTRAWLWMLH